MDIYFFGVCVCGGSQTSWIAGDEYLDCELESVLQSFLAAERIAV